LGDFFWVVTDDATVQDITLLLLGDFLNGCFVYIIKAATLLKEKVIITKKTKAVVCDKWRSIDLDTPEEWVMAEVLYKNKKAIEAKLKKFKR
jgi:CMP-N-acetylneuraminic acid synthetase